MQLITERLLKVFLVGALTITCGCQVLYKWAKASAQPIDWNGRDRIQLPLTLDDRGWPTFPARVLGKDVTAIIDSGTEVASIADELLPESTESSRVNAMVNGQRRASITNVHLDFGPASMVLHTVTVDDSSIHDSVVIGADLLLQTVVELDFEAGVMTVYHPDSFVPPAADPVSTELFQTIPMIQLNLNGKESGICALIDTGFNGELAVTSEVVDDLGLPDDPAGGMSRTLGAFGESITRPALVPLTAMQIGEWTYKDVRVIHARSSTECGNLVGMGILSRNRLIFDLRNGRTWLLPLTPEDSATLQ